MAGLTYNERMLITALTNLSYAEMMTFSEALKDTLNESSWSNKPLAIDKDRIANALNLVASSWRELDKEEKAESAKDGYPGLLPDYYLSRRPNPET